MAEKRGLFQTIFGRPRSPATNSQAQYRLLSSWDSQFTAFSGNAWEINIVRSGVDAFARRAAMVQPRHIRRFADHREDAGDYLDNILRFKPNPYMTAFAFYYRIAAQYKVDNNAFVFPVFDNFTGRLTALYPINASKIELVEYAGEMYVRMHFNTGTVWTCPYEQVIHIRRHYKDNDIFGSNNRPLIPILETANTFTQSMGVFAKLVAVIRGILKVNQAVKGEDLNKRRDDFVRDNLRIENNGAGVVVTDSKYEYTPLNEKQVPIPKGQLDYVKDAVYDYIGVNDAIVQNKAKPAEEDAFYRGETLPFYMQLTQAFTNCLFTERERGYGNEIIFENDPLQFATPSDRVAAATLLTNVGALTLDQVLELFGYAPIGGEEGRRRVQTLNVVNSKLADKYQVGTEVPKQEPPEDGKEEENT